MINHDQYFSYLSSRSRLGHLYRTHWLYPLLTNHLLGRSLDIGCGIGDMLAFRDNMVGVDINPLTVGYCISRGFDARLMLADRLPFEDEQFGSVLLDNVLEHLAEPLPLLHEIRRVLKKDVGVLLVGVPGIKGWASDADHKTFYDENALVDCLSRAGFQHRKTFYTPLFKSSFLDRSMRQYCIYGKFSVDLGHTKT